MVILNWVPCWEGYKSDGYQFLCHASEFYLMLILYLHGLKMTKLVED